MYLAPLYVMHVKCVHVGVAKNGGEKWDNFGTLYQLLWRKDKCSRDTLLRRYQREAAVSLCPAYTQFPCEQPL